MRRLFVLLLTACGTDSDPADPYACMAGGGARCFDVPTTIVEALDVADNPVTPALDCAPPSAIPLGDVTIAGHTIDLVTGAPLPDIGVQIFEDVAWSAQKVDVVSGEYAELRVTAPLPSIAHWRTYGDGRLPFLQVYMPTKDRFDAITTTKADMTALVTSVSDKIWPGKSQLIAHIRDCDGNRLLNTIINIAPATGRNGSKLFEDGVRTYYYADPGMPARRTQLAQTTRESAALATNIPPGRHFVQLWGFSTQADVAQGALGLDLFAELEIVMPDGENAMLVPLTTSR